MAAASEQPGPEGMALVHKIALEEARDKLGLEYYVTHRPCGCLVTVVTGLADRDATVAVDRCATHSDKAEPKHPVLRMK